MIQILYPQGSHASGCGYEVISLVMDDCVSRFTSQLEETSVTFDLCADRKYSFQVHLLNAGGGIATIHLSILFVFLARYVIFVLF